MITKSIKVGNNHCTDTASYLDFLNNLARQVERELGVSCTATRSGELLFYYEYKDLVAELLIDNDIDFI